MHPGRGINARNPELSERTFFKSSVTIRMLPCFVKVMLGAREDFASRTPVTFRARENALATAMGGNFILRTWHSCSFLLLLDE